MGVNKNSKGERVWCTAGKAKTQVENIRKRLVAASSIQTTFVEIAREMSDHASSVYGGDLGLTAEDALEPELFDVASALRPGEVSDVTATPTGIHLILRALP